MLAVAAARQAGNDLEDLDVAFGGGVLLVGVWRAISRAEFGHAVAEERARVAREIHDGVGHYLTVINIQLEAAKVTFEDIAEDAGPVTIVTLPPKETADPLTVIAEFVREAFPILVKVLDAPDIVLLVNVCVPSVVRPLGIAVPTSCQALPSHTLINLAIRRLCSHLL